MATFEERELIDYAMKKKIEKALEPVNLLERLDRVLETEKKRLSKIIHRDLEKIKERLEKISKKLDGLENKIGSLEKENILVKVIANHLTRK